MKKITAVRKKKKISQAYIANKTGISRYKISEFECGYRVPTAQERGLMWAVLTHGQKARIIEIGVRDEK